MPTVRLPLSWPFNPRTPDSAKDQHRVNVMDEVLGERVYTLKRPGTALYLAQAAGEGQGMTFFNGGVYTVVGDDLNRNSAVASGASGAAWTATSDAPWIGRRQCRVIDLNGTIYILGGLAGGVYLSDVWQLSQGGRWLQCTSAAPWEGRASFMVGVIGNKMFVFGGLATGGTDLHDVWSSTNGIDWTEETEAAEWSARDSAGTISADNGIYLLGGTTGAAQDDVWFTTDGITWKEVTAAAGWSARHSMQTYYFDNALWVAGGYTGAASINDTWTSTDAGKTWTQTMTGGWDAGRYGGGALVYNGKMWLINGYTGAAYSNRVYSSTDGATWSLVTTNGPWDASAFGGVYLAPVPLSASDYSYATMWWVGGDNGVIDGQVQYYGDLNLTLAATTPLTTTPADQPMQFAPFNNNDQLLVKNQTNLWVVAGGVVTEVVDDRYPEETVPGIVTLGGFAFVMDTTGLIRNCEINDPFHWPLLGAVGADYESDAGVALVKYLNYVVAFGTYTTQFFYDAGVTNGSPLRPYLNANLKIGCAAASTVVQVGPTVMWVSQTTMFHRQVMMFNGLTPVVVSTPAVDKMLNNIDLTNAELRAISAYSGGHIFYILSDKSGASPTPSFVFDLSTKQWYEWKDITDAGPFDYAASCSIFEPNGCLLLHSFNGDILRFSTEYNDDSGDPFTITLQTGRVDFENTFNKFWGRTRLIGDRNTGTPLIQTTDDDYETFSTGRTQDMDASWRAPNQSLWKEGASTRRAWKVTQSDSNAMRLEALEVTFEQGGDPVQEQ